MIRCDIYNSNLVELCNDGLDNVLHLFLQCLQLVGIGVCVLFQPGNLLIDDLNEDRVN